MTYVTDQLLATAQIDNRRQQLKTWQLMVNLKKINVAARFYEHDQDDKKQRCKMAIPYNRRATRLKRENQVLLNDNAIQK